MIKNFFDEGLILTYFDVLRELRYNEILRLMEINEYQKTENTKNEFTLTLELNQENQDDRYKLHKAITESKKKHYSKTMAPNEYENWKKENEQTLEKLDEQKKRMDEINEYKRYIDIKLERMGLINRLKTWGELDGEVTPYNSKNCTISPFGQYFIDFFKTHG